MKQILETERLLLREMTWDDFGDLCEMLQDPEVMYAYEHAFSDREARDWMQRQLDRYQRDGFGLWAVVLKETGEMVGEAGLSLQDWKGCLEPEIGYHLKRRHWHKGYAAEAAVGCREYAFHTLGLPAVCSIIRDNNLASQMVARRTGMEVVDTFVKHYRGIDMPHLVFQVKNPNGKAG